MSALGRAARTSQAVLLAAVVSLGLVSAQEPDKTVDDAPSQPDKVTLPAAQQAVSEWLRQDWSDDDKRAQVVNKVLDADGGLAWLGKLVRSELDREGQPETARTRSLRQLATRTVVGFVNRGHFSGVVYRGQYAALASLEPFASRRMLELLLNGPTWFDLEWRIRLAPALRDLLQRPPPVPQLLGIVEIVENVEIEPEPLRMALECLLWQWGRKKHVDKRLRELRQQSGEGDAEDRQLAFRALADLYYRVAEYERAAKAQDVLLRMSEVGDLPLTPTDWYWSACYRSLTGDIDKGMAALQKCAALQRSPNVDPSLKLPRELFETDPEIRALRADARQPRRASRNW